MAQHTIPLSAARLIIYGIIGSLVLCGCGEASRETRTGDEVVAKINNYTLTVQDFRDEAGRTLGHRHLLMDSSEAKKALLEQETGYLKKLNVPYEKHTACIERVLGLMENDKGGFGFSSHVRPRTP